MLSEILSGLLPDFLPDSRKKLKAVTLVMAFLFALAALGLAWKGETFLAIASGGLAALFVVLVAFVQLLEWKGGVLGPFVLSINEDDLEAVDGRNR